MNDAIIFKLFKTGDSYYWNGLFNYKESGIPMPVYAPLGGGSYMYGAQRMNTKIKLLHTPYLLNMLTGKNL